MENIFEVLEKHIQSAINPEKITDEFISAFIALVIVTLFVEISFRILKILIQVFKKPRTFNIEGFWIGRCQLPSYGEKVNLEIWKYSLSGENVNLIFFAYNSNQNDPLKWIGKGIFRGPKFSAYYYLLNTKSYESGVMAMELKSSSLSGTYAQFDPNDSNDPLYINPPHERYIQKRIDLPLFSRLRVALGYPPYSTYNEVKSLYNQFFDADLK